MIADKYWPSVTFAKFARRFASFARVDSQKLRNYFTLYYKLVSLHANTDSVCAVVKRIGHVIEMQMLCLDIFRLMLKHCFYYTSHFVLLNKMDFKETSNSGGTNSVQYFLRIEIRSETIFYNFE